LNFKIRPAVSADIPTILRFIRELAEYERLLDQVVATEDDLRRTLFTKPRRAEVLLAYAEEIPAGFALFFHNYSTFQGRPGLYLEDLYVAPDFRGGGIGRALMTHLVTLARERGCGRMEWSVLDWNEPSIAFYRDLGAEPMEDWTAFRLDLTRLRTE